MEKRLATIFKWLPVSIIFILSASCNDKFKQSIWTIYRPDVGYYVCGSTLGGVVECIDYPHQVSVEHCYCMTFNDDIEDFSVDQCPYNCYFTPTANVACSDKNIIVYTNFSISKNVITCSRMNRDGHLCGKCLPSYGYPVYSYTLDCVLCNKKEFNRNLLKYITFGFLPLTLFYAVVITLKLSVHTQQMVTYVFACQAICIPSVVEIWLTEHRHSKITYKAAISLISIWNLDFFRSVYDPFCLHPELTALHVIALDYIIALYPMILIAITYVTVTLHSRYTIVVYLWSPVQRILRCVRKEWDIHGSLVHAFTTFLTMSYVKILNVSFDLLMPIHPFNAYGEHLNQSYMYKAGTVEYLGREHIPFAALALFMMTLFNILPIFLLLLYPYSWFRKCIHCGAYSPTLHTFVESFTGYYKSKPRFCMSFSAVYFLSLFIQLILFSFYRGTSYYFYSTIHFLLLSMLTILLQPHKNKCWNKINSIIILYLSLLHSLFSYHIYSHTYQPAINKRFFYYILNSSAVVLLLYSTSVTIAIVLPMSHIFKHIKNFYYKRFKREETMTLIPHH